MAYAYDLLEGRLPWTSDKSKIKSEDFWLLHLCLLLWIHGMTTSNCTRTVSIDPTSANVYADTSWLLCLAAAACFNRV